jgi:hypothetical protein
MIDFLSELSWNEDFISIYVEKLHFEDNEFLKPQIDFPCSTAQTSSDYAVDQTNPAPFVNHQLSDMA